MLTFQLTIQLLINNKVFYCKFEQDKTSNSRDYWPFSVRLAERNYYSLLMSIFNGLRRKMMFILAKTNIGVWMSRRVPIDWQKKYTNPVLHILLPEYATGIQKPRWVVEVLIIYPAAPSTETKCLVYSVMGTFYTFWQKPSILIQKINLATITE